jgi:nucleoside-diphosphate-sugar epimerase
VIVALTGGTGFVGGHVITALRQAGHQIHALARRPQTDRDGVTWIAGALDDNRALTLLCDCADAVLHIAGITNAPDPAQFDAGNHIGTRAMLNAAQASGIARFVHVSSLTARTPHLSHYGQSKRAGEDAIAASALDWLIVRPPAVYGPGDIDMLDMFRFAQRGVALLPPRGRIAVIHAADLAQLLVNMVENGPIHSLYEPDDGVPGGWSHADFADAIGAAVGRRVMKIALPRIVLSAGAALDRVIRGPAAKLTADRVGYLCHPDWTIDRARAVPPALWTPRIDTRTGLKQTANWYRTGRWL